jgi:protein gp37
MPTKIEWTDETWNPIRGCSRVSEGCRHCYAETVAGRFGGSGLAYEGLTVLAGKQRVWNGQIKFVEEHLLDPLKWKRPRRIFVNSMSDLFHENVTDAMRDRIFAVMALAPQHTFQVLTKRPERMLAYFNSARASMTRGFDICAWVADMVPNPPMNWIDLLERIPVALPNVWLGVSVENQKAADERIPLLLQTPAAKRFISGEPLLGAIDLRSLPALALDASDYVPTQEDIEDDWRFSALDAGDIYHGCGGDLISDGPEHPALDWVICGGESGHGARPMHPDWARGLRDQCVAAGVPFFFKQWGEWEWEEPTEWYARPEDAGVCYGPFRPTCGGPDSDKRMMCRAYPASIPVDPRFNGGNDGSFVMIQQAHRAGKKLAGHLLDDAEWHQFPEVAK